MKVELTVQGHMLLAYFRTKYVDAVCNRCGIRATPPNDGYTYMCERTYYARPCTGKLVAYALGLWDKQIDQDKDWRHNAARKDL